MDREEIDLVALLKPLWTYRLFGGMVMLLILGLFISHTFWGTKYYKSQVTFLVPGDAPNSQSQQLGTLMMLGGLDLAASGDSFSEYMMILFESKKIQHQVTQSILDQNLGLDHVEDAILLLELKKAKLEFVEGLYTLSYHNQNPDWVLPVLEAYLDELQLLYSNLELGVIKHNILIIDEAQLPITHFKPSLKWNLILGIFLGGFLGILSIYVRYGIDVLRQQR